MSILIKLFSHPLKVTYPHCCCVRLLHLHKHCYQRYYEILGVPKTATQKEIKSAYYKLSKLHHPDVSTSPDSKHIFQEVSQAYETLGDVKKRQLYDQTGETSSQERSYKKDTSSKKTYNTSSSSSRYTRTSKIRKEDEMLQELAKAMLPELIVLVIRTVLSKHPVGRALIPFILLAAKIFLRKKK